MEESTTYQAIIEEGEIKGARKIILRQGKKTWPASRRRDQGTRSHRGS